MVVRGEGADLRALPVPATFPAYEDVLAAAGDAHAVVAGRDALHAALVAFADEPGAVLVRVTPGRLALVRRDRRWRSTPSTRDRTWTWRSTPPSQPMPWPRPGPDVVVEISGALRPLVFRSADDGTFTTLLMPVRLTDVPRPGRHPGGTIRTAVAPGARKASRRAASSVTAPAPAPARGRRAGP